MNKKKNPTSKFILEEENGVVIASLSDENDYSLQHTVHGMPQPRIRAPRSAKSKIEEDSKYMAAINHESQEDFLKQNIKGINQEINKHIQEIRKTIKRMQGLTHYVLTAKEILGEIKKNT